MPKARSRMDPGKPGNWKDPHPLLHLGKAGAGGAGPHHTRPPTQDLRTTLLPPPIVAKTSLRKSLGSPGLLGDPIPGDTWASWPALWFAILRVPLKPVH